MKLHHVGLAVDSIAVQAEHYLRALGIGPSSEVVEDEIQRVRVAFVQMEPGVSLEFVEPLDESSPVSRLLKTGGGIYHLCFEVPDLDAAVAQVCAAGGLKISGPVPARAFGGRRIVWVYTKNRALIEFLEDELVSPAGGSADAR